MANELKGAIWHAQDVQHVLEGLDTDIHRGLTDEEVKRRIETLWL